MLTVRPGREGGRLQGFSRLGFATQRIPGLRTNSVRVADPRERIGDCALGR